MSISMTWLEAGDDLPALAADGKRQRLRALLDCVHGEVLSAIDFPGEGDGRDARWLEVRPLLLEGELVRFAPRTLEAFAAWAGAFTLQVASAAPMPSVEPSSPPWVAEPNLIGASVPAAFAGAAKTAIQRLLESAPDLFVGH